MGSYQVSFFLGTICSILLSTILIRPFRMALTPLPRVAFAVALSLPTLNPAFLPQTAASPFSSMLIHLVARSLHGLLIGGLVLLLLEGIPLAGRLIDLSRGAQYSEQLLQSLGERVSPLESIGVLFSGCILLTPLGYRLLLSPLYRFHEVSVNPAELSPLLISVAQDSITLACLVAAPLLVTNVLFDLGAALMSRYLNRTNMSFELLGTKMSLSILLLSLLLPRILDTVQEYLNYLKPEVALLLSQARV